MQLYVCEFDHKTVIDDIMCVRACSRRDPKLRIDPKKMYKKRQVLSLNRNGQYRPDEHSGPRYAFYYTDLAGLMKIWRNNGISPNCVSHGIRSNVFVFLTPAVTTSGDCPEACKAHMDKNNIQITVDLGMMLFDQLTCYYTDDGFIAVRADYIPAAYWCQIFCTRTGFYYFIRPFKIAPGYWTQVLTRPAEPNDTRNIRDILQLPCYICGTDMWSGMVNCFQCGNPIIHEEEVIPTFRDDICGLPATCITAVDADTLFNFRVRVSQGRIARGFQFNITYRVKLPSTNVLTSSLTTGRRSYRKQAERWDQHIVIAHRNKVRSGEYQEGTVLSLQDRFWEMDF